MFYEKQERAQIFINSSDGSINKNMHYNFHIRAYNRIGFSDSGTQEFSKWIMEVMSADSLPQEGGVVFQVFIIIHSIGIWIFQVDYSFNWNLDSLFSWLSPSNIGRMDDLPIEILQIRDSAQF